MDAHSRQPVPDVVTGCLEACRRCGEVVARVVEQSPAAYPTVGPHLRHCVDHFQLLLEGWRRGSVNYDDRRRNPGLEQDPAAVGRALDGICASLAALCADDLAAGMTVLQSVAAGRPPVASPSRLDRELAFLSGHTIHHIAVMVLAAAAAGVAIPAELAVAFSTEHEREALAVEN